VARDGDLGQADAGESIAVGVDLGDEERERGVGAVAVRRGLVARGPALSAERGEGSQGERGR